MNDVHPYKAKHFLCNELEQLFKWEGPLGISLRVHRWLGGDPKRCEHSHPWWFLILCLRGGYLDHSSTRSGDTLRAPALRLRKSGHRHAVTEVLPDTITVVLTGPKRRPWRFWIDDAEVNVDQWNQRPCS